MVSPEILEYLTRKQGLGAPGAMAGFSAPPPAPPAPPPAMEPPSENDALLAQLQATQDESNHQYASDVGEANVLRGFQKINQGLSGVAPDDASFTGRIQGAEATRDSKQKMIRDYMSAKLADQQRRADREFTADQNALQRDATLGAANARAREADRVRQSGVDREEREYSQSVAIPGLERTGDVRPSIPEASQLREGKASVESMITDLNELAQLVKKHGFETAPGEVKDRMGVLSSNITLNGKNAFKLGALSGSDIKLLEDLAQNPTSLWTVAKNLGNSDNLISGYDKFRELLKKGFETKARSMGYTGSIQSGKTVAKKQYSKSRNQTKLIYSDGSEEIVDGRQ